MLRGEVRWVVQSCTGGQRRRFYFRTKPMAEEKARQLRADREGFGRVWLELEPRERAEVCSVLALIKAKGLAVRQVWEAFEAHGMKARGKSVKLNEALERLANSQRSSNLRPNYIHDVGRAVKQFARGREESLVNVFTKAEVEAFVAAAPSPNTRATRRGRLLAFFSFCLREKWVAENVVLAVGKVKVDAKPPRFFSPKECAKVMELVEKLCPQALAWFSLALFAGIRPEDCDRLTWKAVNLEAGEVNLEAASSKLRTRATIPLTPNCLAWLIRAQETKARLPMSQAVRRRCVALVRDGLGLVAWPAKVLRHTFCTYGEILYGAQWVSQRARHSEGILFAHYRNRGATALDAKEFFSIEPKETNDHRESSGHGQPVKRVTESHPSGDVSSAAALRDGAAGRAKRL